MFHLQIMVLIEEGYENRQVNGPVRQKDRGNTEQRKVQRQRMKWIEERNPGLSC